MDRAAALQHRPRVGWVTGGKNHLQLGSVMSGLDIQSASCNHPNVEQSPSQLKPLQMIQKAKIDCRRKRWQDRVTEDSDRMGGAAEEEDSTGQTQGRPQSFEIKNYLLNIELI